jgi:hypothetical protein
MDKGWPGCALPNLFWRLWKPRPIVVLRVVDRGLLAVAFCDGKNPKRDESHAWAQDRRHVRST